MKKQNISAKKGKKSTNVKRNSAQQDKLLEIMLELNYYNSKDGLCATIPCGKNKESVRITSTEYIDYVASQFFLRNNEFPRSERIKERLQLIRNNFKAENGDETFDSRYVNDNGNILINIGNEKMQYFSITPDGYEVITPDDETVLFVKDKLELPMVLPRGQDLDSLSLLDKLLNLTEDDIFFLKVWLVATMNPEIKPPILYFLGAPGTGKSSIQNLIQNIVSPSKRKSVNWDGLTPKEIAISLNRSYLINYDNVSKVDQRRSDMLCQTVTGGTAGFRALYTDNDEIVYNLDARVTISSVRNCIRYGDLAERVYFVNMPRFSKRSFFIENEYPNACEENLPDIIGGLLTVLSIALECYPKWKKKHTAQSRLASFEVFGGLVAFIIGEKKGYNQFKRIMRRNRIQQVFYNDYKRSYFECMLEMIDADEEPYDEKLKDFYECINSWISDGSELSYSGDYLDYETFCKGIHHYEHGIRSLGYDIEFYRSSPDNYSSIRIGKHKEPDVA